MRDLERLERDANRAIGDLLNHLAALKAPALERGEIKGVIKMMEDVTALSRVVLQAIEAAEITEREVERVREKLAETMEEI
jgi:uncharacterized protein YeeX (DUF496 family)